MDAPALREIVERLHPKLKEEIYRLAEMLPKQADRSMASDASIRPQFLDFGTLHYSKLQTWNSGGIWGVDVELAVKLGKDVGVGSLSRRAIGREKEISHLRLFGLEAHFLRWEKGSAEVIQNGVRLGTVEGVWKRHMMLNGADGFACSVVYPLWPWSQAKCRCNRTQVLFPPRWPDSGKWETSQVQAVCECPEQHRNLIVFSILWKNTLNGLSLWQQ
ncbi:MAG: hypothetical protein N3J91_03800 [Verrucomicrobiae bacterium]|nr:hypothetical protein [Verrucomicrobiae bacterium]